MLPADDSVADAESAALDDHRGERPTAKIDFGLDNDTAGLGLRVGLELKHICLEQDHLEEIIDSGAFDRRDWHGHRFPTPVFGRNVTLLHLRLDLLDVGALHVHLIDGDQERDLGVLRVFQRLVRLRHEAVIGRDHEHGDIGDIGSTGAHFRKRRVTRSVEESDLPIVKLDLVGTDVLRDSSRFTGGHVSFSDSIEQGRFTMVDVPENTDHGRTRHQKLGFVLVGFLLFLILGLLLLQGWIRPVLDLEEKAIFSGYFLRHGLINRRVHRRKTHELVQFGDELKRLQAQGRGEVTDHDRRLQMKDLDVTLHRDHRRGGQSGRSQMDRRGTGHGRQLRRSHGSRSGHAQRERRGCHHGGLSEYARRERRRHHGLLRRRNRNGNRGRHHDRSRTHHHRNRRGQNRRRRWANHQRGQRHGRRRARHGRQRRGHLSQRRRHLGLRRRRG